MSKKKKRLLSASFLCLLGMAYFLNQSTPKQESSLVLSEQINAEQTIKRSPASVEQVKDETKITYRQESQDPLEEKNDVQLLKQSLDIYKEQAQYHFTTLPLDDSKTENPLLRHYQNKSFWQGAIQGDKLRARLLSDKEFYSQEKEALLSVESTWKGQKIQAQLKAFLMTPERENLGELNFNSDAKLTLPLQSLSDGIYLIQVEASQGDEKVQLLKSFSLRRDLPQFLSIKSLEITTEKDLAFISSWKVQKTAYYLAEAVLSDEKGKPIAAFEEAIALKEGEQNVMLKFDGFWFYKKRLQGKLTLSQLSLSQIGDALEIKRGPLVEPRYQTHSFSWENFRSTPNPDPVLQEKIKGLEAKLSSL